MGSPEPNLQTCLIGTPEWFVFISWTSGWCLKFRGHLLSWISGFFWNKLKELATLGYLLMCQLSAAWTRSSSWPLPVHITNQNHGLFLFIRGTCLGLGRLWIYIPSSSLSHLGHFVVFDTDWSKFLKLSTIFRILILIVRYRNWVFSAQVPNPRIRELEGIMTTFVIPIIGFWGLPHNHRDQKEPKTSDFLLGNKQTQNVCLLQIQSQGNWAKRGLKVNFRVCTLLIRH